MAKYKVVNAGDLFNGLIVEGEYMNDVLGGWLEVRSVSKTNDKLGQFSIPVPKRSVWFDDSVLMPIIDEDFELDTTSPFGEFVSDGRLEKNGLTLTWSQYENALSLKVAEGGMTLLASTFFDDEVIKSIGSFIAAVVSDDTYDWDDIIFDLGGFQNVE